MIGHNKIALRYIINKGNRFTTFLSMMTMLGIMIGVTSLIVTTSVMNGFGEQIISKILNTVPHIEVHYSQNQKFDNVNGVQSQVLKKEIVIKKDRIKGIQLIGASRDSLDKLNIVNGLSGDGIGLGIGLSESLGVVVGEKIEIIYESKGKKKVKTKKLIVDFIYESGVAAYDENISYMEINTAKIIWPEANTINEIRLKNPMDAKATATEIRKQLDDSGVKCDLCVKTWLERNKNLMSAMETERIVMALILFIIILVSMFNLISSLVMTVKDKTSSICMMKTIGATTKDIRKIFILKGFYLGLIGGTMGVLLGLAISINIEYIVSTIESIVGAELLNPDVYYVSNITSKIEYSEVIIFYVVSIVASVLATIYPSRIASKIEISKGLES